MSIISKSLKNTEVVVIKAETILIQDPPMTHYSEL